MYVHVVRRCSKKAWNNNDFRSIYNDTHFVLLLLLFRCWQIRIIYRTRPIIESRHSTVHVLRCSRRRRFITFVLLSRTRAYTVAARVVKSTITIL